MQCPMKAVDKWLGMNQQLHSIQYTVYSVRLVYSIQYTVYSVRLVYNHVAICLCRVLSVQVRSCRLVATATMSVPSMEVCK